MEFPVDIIGSVKYLKSIIYNQIERGGTSMGANIHKSQYAQVNLLGKVL